MTTFPNISLPATPRSIDVLVVVTPYPDGRLQDKQAVVNEGQYLGYIPICFKKSTATKLSSYSIYYRRLLGSKVSARR
ncbi:MAG: hypothetical protein KC643_19120 [Nitrospira sp.]|nr:hypothetical protein [Nitrospira sp.]